MRILKASAGSGKTYELSHSYIDLLLKSKDRYAYRHILAVTFTNKATAEMKSRILRDLKEEAKTNPKAHQILSDILHDYGSFAISTIDKFFQQTLKAFSREIGQFNSYQIELDRESLIRESTDRILDNLDPSQHELLSWLRQSTKDEIEQGGKINIEEGLFNMAKMFLSEKYRELQELYNEDEERAYSKERLSELRSLCRKVLKDFEEKTLALGYDKKEGDVFIIPKAKDIKDNPELEELYVTQYALYHTAHIINKQIYTLGLAREIHKSFNEILKEKNVLSLDDSNTILRDIIDGSDAPFIYEKLGVRFEHFLLDEFQDTSRIQWDNFLPLLKESESKKESSDFGNLIVGDVKQSIYRWRNSDWRLLGGEVEKAFPESKAEKMEYNWRSARAIVDFNNRFFDFASKEINAGIYEDVYQIPRNSEEQEGHIKLSFEKEQEAIIVDSVKDALGTGALLSDIVVLVRGKIQGSKVAQCLIAEGFPVISNDSLSIKSSATVRRLVSLLSHIDNPDNTVGAYIARKMGIEVPENFHSLIDLCEGLLRSIKDYDGESFEAECLYIQAFMDKLRDWCDINGNNLRNFLSYWDTVDPCIGSPESAESIRIMTIHKSKGLEFPHVILPYAEKLNFYKVDTHWCHLDKNNPLSEKAHGLYPVNLSSQSKDSLFSDDYSEEYQMQTIDALNLTYVALTRAAKSLHIIAAPPGKTWLDPLKKGKEVKYTDFAKVLYAFCYKEGKEEFGQRYDFSKMKRDAPRSEEDFVSNYHSIALGDRLKASDDAIDFFGEEALVGAKASSRLNGIALHKILEGVRTIDELPKDIAEEDYALLRDRINAHPEWFTKGRIRNEVSIIDTNGREYRPDRVIINEDEVFVLDYKFGAERETKHLNQVRKYISLYKQMGYPKVSGAVWYVLDDEVVRV